MTSPAGHEDGVSFDDDVVRRLLDLEHPVARPWLDEWLEHALDVPDRRVVLLVGEPGAGKSVALARLAEREPLSLRYFLRRDALRTHRPGDVHSLLEGLGHQLAATRPDLFLDDDLVLEVTQSAATVAPGAHMIGVRIDEIVASPFRRAAVRVRQEADVVVGDVIGLVAARVVLDTRALPPADVAHLALLGPVAVLARTGTPDVRVVVVIDALDEAPDTIAAWLAELPPLPPTLRIVVSSRPGEHLEAIRLAQADRLLELELDTGDERARDDVARYLRDATEQLEQLPPGTGDPVGRWSAAAGGNFQYAATLLAAVRDAQDAGDADTVERLVAPHAVPAGLRELYRLVVTRLRARTRGRTVRLEDGSRESLWDEVHGPVLAGLAIARQPVTASELALLVTDGVATGRVRDALGDLAPFLDRRDGAHRFHHRSLADFLTDPDTASQAPECHVDAAEWHLRLGVAAGRAVTTDPPAGGFPYGYAHAVDHLVQAGAAAARGETRALLSALTTRPDVLALRVGAVGPDVVAGEQALAVPLLGDDAGPAAAELGRVLDRQAHVLRVEDRAPLLQQLHNESRVAGYAVAADLLATALPDGPLLAVSWSAGPELRPLRRTVALDATPTAFAIIDHARFAVAANDGTVRVHDLASGRQLASRRVSSDAVPALAWSHRHGLVWGGVDARVGRWHPDTDVAGELATVGLPDATTSGLLADGEVWMTAPGFRDPVWLSGGPGSVHALAVRDSDGEVVVGTRQGGVLVVHPDFDGFAGAAALHELVVTGLWFGDREILSCGHDRAVRSTDLRSGTLRASAPSAYTALARLVDGRVLCTRRDGATDVLPADPDGEVSTLAGDTGSSPATAVAAGPGGGALVGYADRRVRVLDEALTTRLSLRGHGGEITALATTGDGTVLSGARDLTVRVWDVRERAVRARPEGHDGPVSALRSVRGILISGAADGTLRAWDPTGGTVLHQQLGAGQLWDICLLSATRVAIATQSTDVLVVDFADGRTATLPGHPAEVRSVTRLDERRFASADLQGRLLVWEEQGGGWHRRQAASSATGWEVHRIAAVTPELVAVADGDDAVSLVTVSTGSVERLRAHRGPVFAVGAGPAGTLLSGAHDGTARVWDPHTGRCRLVYEGHRSDVSAIASLGDDLVVTGAGNGEVHVWAVTDGARLAAAVLDQPVDVLEWDRERGVIAAGHANGSLTVLDAQSVLDDVGGRVRG